MLNSKPNNKNYNQGNYIPKNKDKVLKLNTQGGVYFRSSWEKKIMTWLDHNNNITKWGAECMRIPYQMTHFDNGDSKVKEHCYYPDFYYVMRIEGVLKQVVVEVKPQKEYDLKMAYKNKTKWETMIAWCNKKGYEFIIITEDHLKKFNL